MNENLYQQLSSMIFNPQMQNLINFIKQSGKPPKDIFYAECEKRGVDPETILSKLR